jgi:hypothetical protein
MLVYFKSNCHKKYQHFPFQDPPKYTKNDIFGMKINHLANLDGAQWSRFCQPKLSPTRLEPILCMTSGTNPAILIYNSSTVKIYSAPSSLVHFEDKKYFLLL